MLAAFMMAASAYFSRNARADEAPIPVIVFFSHDEPHWRASEKIIGDTVAQNPRLKLTKIDIDSPAGYHSLHAYEEAYKIPDRADLTVAIGSMTLFSKGDVSDVEKYFSIVIDRALGNAHVKGKLPVDAAAYARDIFGKDATVTENSKGGPDRNITFFRVSSGGKDVGWVADAYQVIECPICADAQFLIAVKSPDLTAIDIRPVRELELRGTKLDEKSTSALLNQFKGRGPEESRKNVDAISGATKTTVAYHIAFAVLMAELKLLEKK